VIIDYTKEIIILAALEEEGKETIVGRGQYAIHERSHTTEVAFAVRDDYQSKGIGTTLLTYLTYLAKRQGLLGFTAEVLVENRPMMNLFEKMGFDIKKRMSEGVYELDMMFK
jgi:GNAT superfamily N-acetyltransferase